MELKIASWNIDLKIADKGVTDETKKKISEGNKHKLKVAEYLVEKHRYGMFALLEADSDENAQLEIEGYKKVYCGRNYNSKEYNWNGILLYVKECYNPKVCEEVLEEFKNNNSSCFLPLIITNDNVIFHCIFVWTLQSQEEWKVEGGKTSYGYNRFDEVMGSEDEGKYRKTRDFINGKNHNVIVIGDYNIYYQRNDYNKERVERWKDILQMMKNYFLVRKDHKKDTFGKGSNDHCFVSEKLCNLTTIDVGEKSYDEVKSNHNLISLTIKSDF